MIWVGGGIMALGALALGLLPTLVWRRKLPAQQSLLDPPRKR